MRRPSSDRLLVAGGALATIGGAGVVSYYIYVESGAHRSFWDLPGDISLAVTIVGVLMLVLGLFGPDGTDRPSQHQQGGDNSINIQGGRDVHIGKRTED